MTPGDWVLVKIKKDERVGILVDFPEFLPWGKTWQAPAGRWCSRRTKNHHGKYCRILFSRRNGAMSINVFLTENVQLAR